MRVRATVCLLPDGRRLHLNDGPIDLIVEADGARQEICKAYEAATERFVDILDELCDELPLLRSGVTQHSSLPAGSIACCMFRAVAPFRTRWFITPMAAVAGAVAEAVLAAMCGAAKLRRAYVNNGGDIAVHLAPGQNYRIGMIERPDWPTLFGTVELRSEFPVRGIATSGWRGRSFSLGIADATTVLAGTAAQADAAATIVGNAVDLPGRPGITRIPAREIAPDSDLGDLVVTRGVAPLRPAEVAEAMERGAAVAQQLCADGLIRAAALCLQGQIRVIGADSMRGTLCLEELEHV